MNIALYHVKIKTQLFSVREFRSHRMIYTAALFLYQISPSEVTMTAISGSNDFLSLLILHLRLLNIPKHSPYVLLTDTVKPLRKQTLEDHHLKCS